MRFCHDFLMNVQLCFYQSALKHCPESYCVSFGISYDTQGYTTQRSNLTNGTNTHKYIMKSQISAFEGQKWSCSWVEMRMNHWLYLITVNHYRALHNHRGRIYQRRLCMRRKIHGSHDSWAPVQNSLWIIRLNLYKKSGCIKNIVLL